MGRPSETGFCFLCREEGLTVTWVGPVEADGTSAPVYACGACCEFTRHYVRQYHSTRDSRPAT
ncbi:hypothetical protein ACWCPT_12555 [Streptomyces sp. NPDC002308]